MDAQRIAANIAKLPELIERATLKPINDGDDHKCADRTCSDPHQAKLQSLTVQIAILLGERPRGRELANFDCPETGECRSKICSISHSAGVALAVVP